jgi:hypothetical protein
MNQKINVIGLTAIEPLLQLKSAVLTEIDNVLSK